MYIRNFGEFFNDQVKNADVIVLSRTGDISEQKLLAAVDMLHELNGDAVIITTPWDELSGGQFTEAMEHRSSLAAELAAMAAEHDDDDDDDECDDEECECHHHHDGDEDHDEHEHHHHDGDEDHDEHEHHHHHHHHADEVFTSWGSETPRKFTEEGLSRMLTALDDAEKYGMVLRAKGMVDASDGEWLYFDYVPGEMNIRRGAPVVTGRFCVIGSKINEPALKELFDIE
jgi:G3E family GTPase